MELTANPKNENHETIAGASSAVAAAVQREAGPLSPISPVAILRLHAELLHELSLRRGRRGQKEVEISSRDIRVHEPSRARCNCEGGGWVGVGGVGGLCGRRRSKCTGSISFLAARGRE